MYFPKVIELDEVTQHSEPTIQIVRPGDLSVPHVKLASEALDYIKHVKPVEGKTIILVLAMTAGEFYGGNRNGDGWNERRVKAGPVIITPEEGLAHRYKTFETHGNLYKHHVNKDPLKRIGGIQKAFYSWPMHRVELLLVLDDVKAEDFVQRIHKEEYPAVSMGCRIRFDVCNICGNKAPTRLQYCNHARYHLGKYLPDGRPVFVWNPNATFFDISMVHRPSERIAFMMKKVANDAYEIRSSAELGERVDGLQRKMAIARKLSVMNKVINGGAVAAKEDDGDTFAIREFANEVAKPASAVTPPLEDDTIREMIQSRPAEVLSTLADMGIFLTTPEFIKYFVWHTAPELEVPDETLDRAAATQQHVLQALAQNPELIEEIAESGFLDMCPENVKPELVERFRPLLEKRSQHSSYLRGRLVTAALKPGQGHWDILEVPDPATGQMRKTTRGAIEAARKFNERLRSESTLRNLFGTGALLSGAYKLMGHKPTGVDPHQAQAAFAPPRTTTTGEQIPYTTELSLKSASLHLANDRARVKIGESPDLTEATFDGVSRWLGDKIACL